MADDPQRLLAAMSQSLGLEGFPGQQTVFLCVYDYEESGQMQRCGFICEAPSMRAAAENYWNQHPGEWFHLISVTGGGITAYWQRDQGTFVTVPGRDVE